MILPLHKMLATEENRYILALAAMKRANQITNNPGLVDEESRKKPVSAGIAQTLNKAFKYSIDEENE